MPEIETGGRVWTKRHTKFARSFLVKERH